MIGFFGLLQDRVDSNARRAVKVYTSELPDFRSVAGNPRARAAMLDFAVLLRRREVELAAEGEPFTAADLEMLAAFGKERGTQGVSLAAQRRVLVLHSVLTLREIEESARPHQIGHVMHVLGWLPTNGLAAQDAYTKGFLAGQKRFLSTVDRVQDLAGMLLSDNFVAEHLAASLDLRLAANYLVVVLRLPSAPFGDTGGERDAVVDFLYKRYQVPMAWHAADEFIALLPNGNGNANGNGTSAVNGAEPHERALQLACDFTQLIEGPCALGAASGRTHNLTEPVALARRISRVSPAEYTPSRLPTLPDVFVELSVSQQPQVDQWLRELADRLSTGPDLVATLDAFYRYDMNRLNTAGALRIHPRTLDYRLQRVRDLIGINPSSTHGVRTLSAAVSRLLAGHSS
ncbi:MAG: helix-turn-helix domain-containing protein [Kibdelosporangium sp.]